MSNHLLRGAVFGENATAKLQLESVLSDIRQFTLIRHCLPDYPEEADLATFLRVQAPAIVFIELSNLQSGLDLATLIGRNAPGVQLVGISSSNRHKLVLTAMRAGMREFLTSPVKPDEMADALCRLQEVLKHNPPSAEHKHQTLTFLPSKPGVGASTICLNMALMLSKLPHTRVGLLDFDLYCSVLGFMMKLPDGFSILDAAQHADRMDGAIWDRMITNVHGIGLLRAAKPNALNPVPAEGFTTLLRYSQRHYEVVCNDLPGSMDDRSIDVMKDSNRVFLVSTPELTSLYSAKRSLAMLDEYNLRDRVQVIINRQEPRPRISIPQMEDLLGKEVFAAFPNDYGAVQSSVSDGRAIALDSVLGKGLLEVAHRVMGITPPAAATQKKSATLTGYLEKFKTKVQAVAT